MAETRIIDRDIEFYQGVVEELTAKLRRCEPDQEPRIERLRAANNCVVSALEDLRTALEE